MKHLKQYKKLQRLGMDPKTKENWAKVKAALETANKTETYFYKRAVVICNGEKDPLLGLP